MPHMTGAQLLTEARARVPGLSIILASGYAELPSGTTVDVQRLSKPFSQADLADALLRAAQGR